jgi:hypothetical protein
MKAKPQYHNFSLFHVSFHFLRRSIATIFSQVGFLFCCADTPAAFLVPCKRRGQQPLDLLCSILRMLQATLFPFHSTQFIHACSLIVITTVSSIVDNSVSQGTDPQRRRVDTHIEMEAWHQFAFIITRVLHNSVISNISHALLSISSPQLATICSCLSHQLMKCEYLFHYPSQFLCLLHRPLFFSHRLTLSSF